MASRDELGQLIIHEKIPTALDTPEVKEALLFCGYKFCSGTKQLLQLAEFALQKDSPSGLQGYCREFNVEDQEVRRKRSTLESRKKEIQDEIDALED
ncbi:hypothetical protein ES705_18371 [subsurface metagenome]